MSPYARAEALESAVDSNWTKIENALNEIGDLRTLNALRDARATEEV